MAAGNPTNVDTGPGLLYAAPFGTTEPTNATTPLGAAYVPLGYTEDGVMFDYEITRDTFTPAEEVHPVKSWTTKIVTKVSFGLVEATSINLALLLNKGVITAPTSVAPPNPNAEVYISIVHVADNGARWLFRKAIQTGKVGIPHKKAPKVTVFPAEFTLFLPTVGQPFEVWASTGGLV
jgi:hypothetical protein